LVLGSAVSLGAGTAFALRATSKDNQSNANGHCDSGGCDDEGLELREDALSSARIATGLFVAGGVLGGAALTVYLVSSNSKSAAKPPALTVGYSGRSLGVAMRGSF
jgi:hypothetical protein